MSKKKSNGRPARTDSSRRRTNKDHPASTRRHPIVLVVDDDPDARQIYSAYLKAKGCDVFVASDGKAAIEKAEWLSPDVIVMDLAMPRVDGWAAISRLKSSSWTRRIPIIALSAVQMAEESSRAAGANVFVEKPCLPDVLWHQISALLEKPSA